MISLRDETYILSQKKHVLSVGAPREPVSQVVPNGDYERGSIKNVTAQTKSTSTFSADNFQDLWYFL